MLSPHPPPPPPPPPPLPPPLFPLEDSSIARGGDHYSYNPSILIIAAIIAAAIVAAASIHHLLRVLSRSRSSPFVHHLASSSSSSSSSPSSASAPSSPSDHDPKAVIDSLPLFSLSSPTAKPSSSLDCAVCLSPFQPSDELRLLPACHHAFHAQCIDTWLKSNLSCPLCRSPITPIPAPPPAQPPPAAEPPRSESFRVEIGSVSRRTDDSPPTAAAPHARSYSIGSSFEYVVEEEIEAVLARVRRRPAVEKSDLEQTPPPPGEELAEIAGGSHRSWLKEYVDRLASSASSSFSSLRFSRQGSHQFDPAAGGGGVVGGESWDLERNLHLHLEEEDGGFSAFYRWIAGA